MDLALAFDSAQGPTCRKNRALFRLLFEFNVVVGGLGKQHDDVWSKVKKVQNKGIMSGFLHNGVLLCLTLGKGNKFNVFI